MSRHVHRPALRRFDATRRMELSHGAPPKTVVARTPPSRCRCRTRMRAGPSESGRPTVLIRVEGPQPQEGCRRIGLQRVDR